MESDWRKTLLVCRTEGDSEALVPDVSVTRQDQIPMRQDLLDLFELSELEKYFTDEELAQHPERSKLMAYQASMRVWRGDHDGGGLQDYSVEVNEGEVVLDIIHRLQQTQTPDLAVRWNCKAGKCGSCSAEINGRPRLMCMTRMSTFARERDHHGDAAADVPDHPRPGHRRVVQLRKGQGDPVVHAAEGSAARRVPDDAGGREPVAGVPQVHRVLPVPEHLPRRA